MIIKPKSKIINKDVQILEDGSRITTTKRMVYYIKKDGSVGSTIQTRTYKCKPSGYKKQRPLIGHYRKHKLGKYSMESKLLNATPEQRKVWAELLSVRSDAGVV